MLAFSVQQLVKYNDNMMDSGSPLSFSLLEVSPPRTDLSWSLSCLFRLLTLKLILSPGPTPLLGPPPLDPAPLPKGGLLFLAERKHKWAFMVRAS